MTFRMIAEFEALTGNDAPTSAETQLIAACRVGGTCWLGDGKRPDTDTDARHIRASLLRLLIVGGSDDCGLADRGVYLCGGWIYGELNLDFATGRGFTDLVNCHFTHEPKMNAAKLGSLNLAGSKLPGIFAQGLKVARSIVLSNSFHATETVVLNGADIGGQLICTKGQFEGNGKDSLAAQGIKVAQDVFLDKGFHATGTVYLSGAVVSGQLACTNGRFDGNGKDSLNAQQIKIAKDFLLNKGFHATGTVYLNGADINGQLNFLRGRFDGNGKQALIAENMRVKAALFWSQVTISSGAINLNGAHIGDLVDNFASWPRGTDVFILDGFTYDRIATFTDTIQRLDWLQRGAVWKGKFHPQPYVQLAKTLRAQGHVREALRVSYEGEKLGRLHEREQLLINPDGSKKSCRERINAYAKRGWLAFWDGLLRGIVGYGLYPFRSVFWLILLIAFTTFPAHYAWKEGSMVPNSAPILVSSGWLDVAGTPNPAKTWSQTDPGRDWETFSSLAWTIDLVIPIIDLGQTSAWAPSMERGPWGANLWWARWLLIMAGWIVTALGAAAITGIIRRE